jgi:hypothetical protein
MAYKNIELRARDYIPIIGVYEYCGRNSGQIYGGLEGLLDNFELPSDQGSRKLVKHTFERAGLLLFYNAAVISAVGNLVNKMFN